MHRRVFLLPIYLLLIWGIARFCHHQTKAFRVEKIRGNTSPLEEQFSPPLSDKIRPLLHQKFTYFGRGLQSFSFLGEDGQTVLKIFNNLY